MARTRGRAFVTGALPHHPAWLLLMARCCCWSVGAAWAVLNPLAALFVFLGAFFYGGGLHRVAEAAQLDEHRHRRPGGQLRGARRRGCGRTRRSVRCRCCSRWCCSCGRRRISGAWRLPAMPITRRPACRCCRWWSAPRAARVVCGARALVVASLLPGLFGAGRSTWRARLAGGVYFVHKARALARTQPQDGDGFVLRLAGAAQPAARSRPASTVVALSSQAENESAMRLPSRPLDTLPAAERPLSQAEPARAAGAGRAGSAGATAAAPQARLPGSRRASRCSPCRRCRFHRPRPGRSLAEQPGGHRPRVGRPYVARPPGPAGAPVELSAASRCW